LLLDYAFDVLNLHRVEARIAITNHRSRRAFERLGGRREGTLKESFYKDGAFQDQGLYVILATEWQSRGGGTAVLESLPGAETDA
jgi:RimJ/RimL family protein N-acetyltransferase